MVDGQGWRWSSYTYRLHYHMMLVVFEFQLGFMDCATNAQQALADFGSKLPAPYGVVFSGRGWYVVPVAQCMAV